MGKVRVVAAQLPVVCPQLSDGLLHDAFILIGDIAVEPPARANALLVIRRLLQYPSEGDAEVVAIHVKHSPVVLSIRAPRGAQLLQADDLSPLHSLPTPYERGSRDIISPALIPTDNRLAGARFPEHDGQRAKGVGQDGRGLDVVQLFVEFEDIAAKVFGLRHSCRRQVQGIGVIEIIPRNLPNELLGKPPGPGQEHRVSRGADHELKKHFVVLKIRYRRVRVQGQIVFFLPQRRFGSEVAELVDGVTKLNKLDFANREEAQAESVRKMILAMS
ncbi:MAG: HD domain-containing protein, partial [Clostridia bacterium]|nr:HD domain-containing protein [Clostridia bacterium]